MLVRESGLDAGQQWVGCSSRGFLNLLPGHDGVGERGLGFAEHGTGLSLHCCHDTGIDGVQRLRSDRCERGLVAGEAVSRVFTVAAVEGCGAAAG